MTDGTDEFITASSAKPRGLCALAATWLLAVALNPAAAAPAQNAQNGAGAAQAAPAQPAQSAQPVQPTPGTGAQTGSLFPAQPPPAAPQPGGFIYAFGRWWDSGHGKPEDPSKQSNNAANSAGAAHQDAMQGAAQTTKGVATATQDALKNAAQATKEAATAIFRLPNLRMIEVHQRCSIAPNGAPDCRMAATNACRAKGFSDGHPVNVQSSENCPPAVWMSGREPAAGECPEETVILMVACQ